MNRTLKIVLSLLLLAILLLFLWSIMDLLRVVIIAALLAFIFDPLATRLESHGLSRTLSTVLVFFILILLFAGFVILILPAVTREAHALQQGISGGKAQQFFTNLELTLRNRLSFLGIAEFNLTEKMQTFLSHLGEQVFSYLLNVVSVVTNLVLIPFIMFFLIKDGRTIKKNLIGLIPNRYFEFSLNLMHKTDIHLGNYLRGQFMDAFIIGVLSVAALWILDVNYFLVIGAFAGLANMIPYIGPFAGAIPAIIVSIMQTGSLATVPWIAGSFTLIQLIDNVLVQPLVVAKTVNLHPLLVLLVVIIGGQFFGVLGMILAVPATGVIKVIAEESYYSFKQFHFN